MCWVGRVFGFVTKDEQASQDMTPEETDMEGQLKKLVAWRDENTPDLEVWDTEFGWASVTPMTPSTLFFVFSRTLMESRGFRYGCPGYPPPSEVFSGVGGKLPNLC